jgi:hypothetical protein
MIQYFATFKFFGAFMSQNDARCGVRHQCAIYTAWLRHL